MDVNVTMSAEEFVKFLEFQKDEKANQKRIARLQDDLKLIKQKVCWAVAPDHKRDGRYKITDQDHMDDLWNMCSEQ